MAGGKNLTQRIEGLEDKVANVSARLDVHDAQIKALTAVLEKGTAVTEGHTSKLTVIEQVLVLVDLKGVRVAIVAIEKENLGVRKDVEALQQWKNDLKKEKEEVIRRWWSFGPNISAAIISGLIGLMILALSYWLNAPK